jgi:hypothetical protein
MLAKRLSNKLILCIVSILVLSIFINLVPVFGDSYTLTVSTDASNYAKGTTVTISGLLTDITTHASASGLLVSIRVTDPLGTIVYTTIAATNSVGSYSTSYIDQQGTSQQKGTYTVLAVAAQDGNQIATASTTFKVTSTVPPTIIINPTSALIGTTVQVTGSDFTGSSPVLITFDGNLLSTTPSRITSTPSGNFLCYITVPTTSPGAHTIQAMDGSINPGSVVFTVTAPTPTPTPTPTASPTATPTPTPSPSPPPTEWTGWLTASQNGYTDSSYFGIRSDATYDFNTAFDQVKSPSPPQGVYGYLYYPNNPTAPVNLQKLGKSIVGPWPVDNATWTYQVKAVGSDGTLTISWSNIGMLASKYNVSLLNGTNGATVADMRQAYSYSFQAAADVTYMFTIQITTNNPPVMLNLSPGWNMVSFQVIPNNSSFSSIFSNVSYYQVLSWNGNGYTTPTTAEAGKGYWILVLKTANITLTGQPVTSYQLNAQQGWNLIGGINGKSISTANLFGGSFYQIQTWNGNQYVASGTIDPGKSYWLLVTAPKNLTVS